MSLLKKLNKKVRQNAIPKPTMSKETAENNMKNAIFQVDNATFVLIQRLAEGLDVMVATRKAMEVPMSRQEAAYINHFDTIVKQFGAFEETFRQVHINRNEHGSAGIDDLHYQFHSIISKMEQMSFRDLAVFQKAADTISSNGRYMHIDTEEAYLDTLLSAAKHGQYLTNQGRKRITITDIKKLVKPEVNTAAL